MMALGSIWPILRQGKVSLKFLIILKAGQMSGER